MYFKNVVNRFMFEFCLICQFTDRRKNLVHVYSCFQFSGKWSDIVSPLNTNNYILNDKFSPLFNFIIYAYFMLCWKWGRIDKWRIFQPPTEVSWKWLNCKQLLIQSWSPTIAPFLLRCTLWSTAVLSVWSEDPWGPGDPFRVCEGECDQLEGNREEPSRDARWTLPSFQAGTYGSPARMHFSPWSLSCCCEHWPIHWHCYYWVTHHTGEGGRGRNRPAWPSKEKKAMLPELQGEQRWKQGCFLLV